MGQLLTGTAQGLLLLFVGLWANRLGARTLATAGAGLVALWAFPLYALSLCYQGCSVIGGFAPIAATWLLSISGGASWPVATLLCVVAATSAVGAFLCRRPRSEVEVPDETAALKTA